ncbi:MAG: hypothetical protein JWQ03_3235 [Variovorax sp.]|nr:hypothetical protein [Variovorax sp.]
MTIDASLTLPWADGDHTFRLAIGELRQLQEKLDAGPVEIFDRLMNRGWRLDDIRETIRLGLIGGGRSPAEAARLVRDYIDGRPLIENVETAQQIIAAAMIGPPDEPSTGKTQPEQAQTEARSVSSSPASMEQAPL